MESATESIGHRMDGDVLITDKGVAFLIGGNHLILKYVLGEISPSSTSIDNFEANIASRYQMIRKSGRLYAHVIFPDKQSVLLSAFPFHPIIRLGELYLEHMRPELQPSVIYPADRLLSELQDPYYPLDTHLTDNGSLVVLRMMLESVGVQADDALERIASRIVKPVRWTGDLGNKFDPLLYQEGIMLDPDWPVKEFRSAGGLNDGMVDIFLSPNAPIRQTVLLFGDSFFRMMLKHLSGIFTRIICLRTRFLHPEMITLIQPDIVFSGNAERYLSNVSADQEANAFALYPHIRGDSELYIRGEFLKAWNAVTSPRSKQAHSFFETHGVL